eukprot:scaffold4348_cov135-Isochrysis_galbana.AAC.6
MIPGIVSLRDIKHTTLNTQRAQRRQAPQMRTCTQHNSNARAACTAARRNTALRPCKHDAKCVRRSARGMRAAWWLRPSSSLLAQL